MARAQAGAKRGRLVRRAVSPKLFVELFSVVLAFLFLMSAITQVYIFRAWGVDYLSVASTADVIMGGIRALLALMFNLAVLSLFLPFLLAFQARRGMWLAAGLVSAGLVFLGISLVVGEVRQPFYVVTLVMMWAICFVLVRGMWRANPRSFWRRCRVHLGKDRKFLFVMLAGLVLASLEGLAIRDSGLEVADAAIAGGCEGERAPVIWLGSGNMVVRCSGEMMVVYNGEDVVLRRAKEAAFEPIDGITYLRDLGRAMGAAFTGGSTDE